MRLLIAIAVVICLSCASSARKHRRVYKLHSTCFDSCEANYYRDTKYQQYLDCMERCYINPKHWRR